MLHHIVQGIIKVFGIRFQKLYKIGGGVPDVWSAIYCKKNKFYNHIPAVEVKHRLPRKIWNTYFKFCVERNPWDKTLSHYHMLNDRQSGRLSLAQYFEKGNFCINFPLYTDSHGRLLLDKVVKYESLMDELENVFRKLGIQFEGSLGVRAKSDHRKDNQPYQDIFSEKQADVIKKKFTQEIEMHGYTF